MMRTLGQHSAHDPTERVKIGKTDVFVSRLAVGGSVFGGSNGKEMTDDDCMATMQCALDNGLFTFDTAPHYGYKLSEERLGRWLAGVQRDRVTLCTKVGMTLVPRPPDEKRGPFDFVTTSDQKSKPEFTGDAIKRSFDASLRRLGVDYFDIVHVHDPDEGIKMSGPNADPYDPRTNHFREVMEHVYPELEKLRAQGRIRAIGVGINQWEMLRDFAREGDFDVFLLAHHLTLLEHRGAVNGLLPDENLRKKGIRIIAGSVFHGGVLADGADPADKRPLFHNSGPPSEEILAHVRRIEAVCRDFKVPLAAASIQFPLLMPSVAAVVVGMRSVNEVQANLAHFRHPIPPGFWQALRKEELIAAEVPA